MKKCLLNSKSKEELYKGKAGLPLPSVPVITRWKTWLETAEFYTKNFNSIKLFVNALKRDPKNKSTKAIKSLINDEELMKKLFALNDFKF